MFVVNRMTKHPVTVSSATKVDEAIHLLKKHNIRRLPVVDDGKLVGIVTDKDLMRVTPSAATTLAKYEINSLLSGISVGEIMSKSVISVNESAPIEEAALLMSRNRVSGLPVTSDVGAVVGVITETDIFDAFVNIMDLEEGKTRITLEVADKVGVVCDLAGIVSEAGYNIDSFVTCRKEGGKYDIIMRGDFEDTDALAAALAAHGYVVQHIGRIGHA